MNAQVPERKAHLLCSVEDLVPGSGVAALYGNQQIALFYLPNESVEADDNTAVFAIGNFDPISEANVLSRGIVGDIGDEPVVASPIYKQHFSLVSGHCLEDEQYSVPVYPVQIIDGSVVLVETCP